MPLISKETIAESFIGEIVSIGIELGQRKFKNKVNKEQLRKYLEMYIDQQSIINNICTLDEEIDFQSLADYIHNNLLIDIENMAFNCDSKIRNQSRKNIASKAIELSGAKTRESKSRVINIILSAIDMIKDFYKRKIDKKYYIIADEVVEAVGEKIDDSQNSTHQKIDNLSHQISELAVFSPEHILKLSEDRNISGIEDLLSLLINSASKKHPLNEYYKYNIIDGQLFSQPLSQEATKKYPPKMVCNGTAFMGNKELHYINQSTFDYANRHQLEIKISVEDAKKYLGDIEDPSQYGVKNLIGHTVVIKPKPFPPAMPCSIKINGETTYEYITLRTKEILDDGTYIVDNSEQTNINTKVQVSFNYNDVSKKIDFNLSICDCPTEERLKFVKTMKAALDGCYIEIYALEHQKNLIEGDVKLSKYNTGFKSIDEEIDFLERINDIENYFNKRIDYAKDIYTNDLSVIQYLSELIRGNKFEWNNFESFTFFAEVTEHFKEQLLEKNNKPSQLWIVGNFTAKLFDEKYNFNVARCFKSVQLEDFEKILKKVELYDLGEKIKLTYAAFGEKKIEDYLYKGDPDNFDEANLIE